MKAMVLTAPGSLDQRAVKRPQPRGGECLVQVSYSGICGTDLKIFRGDIPARYPLIMGHETVGTVVDGSAAGGIAPGSRVIIDPELYCGSCFHCRLGHTNLCPTGQLVGRDCDGGFAELVSVPASNVTPLPETVGEREAPLVQVLSTCVHAQQRAPVSPGEHVVVTGLGVTGQLHVQLAKAAGARVIGITRSRWRRRLAEELGADATLTPGADLRQQVLELTEGRGADLVIETVGTLALLGEAIELARTGGRVLAFAIYTAGQGPLPFYQIYFKELTLIGARAATAAAFVATMELVRRRAVRLEPLVSHTLPITELQHALELMSADEPERMKIIMRHDAA